MPVDGLVFEDFLIYVEPYNQDFVRETHENMLQNGCKFKLATAKNGYVASYQHVKSKLVVMNFVFRKTGLIVRIYGDNVGKYTDFLESLPEGMKKSIVKAPSCKRFLNPPKCNSKCGGNVFLLGGTQHQKCRYNCFMFPVDEESMPPIRRFLEHELTCRNVQQSDAH